jgi:hypothetical protein
MAEDAPTVACPACGVALAAHLRVPWGDGHQRLPRAPWICASCAALGLIDLATGVIVLTPDALWAPVQESNPTLWAQITEARACIREEHPHD